MSCARTQPASLTVRAGVLVAITLLLPLIALAQCPAYLVKDINTGVDPLASSDPQDLAVVDHTLYFTAIDPVHGRALWRSDGSEAGTVFLKDINPQVSEVFSVPYTDENTSFFLPPMFTDVGGTAFFLANDGVTGPELWKSDGTADGTVLVKDIRPGPLGSVPYFLTAVGKTVFFAADDGSGGELWKSDGTAAGTVRVKAAAPGTDPYGPIQLTNLNGRLFFLLDAGSGSELWTSDGTDAGTQRFLAIHPDQLTVAGGLLFFFVGYPNATLWRSDGTVEGTYALPFTLNANPSGVPRLTAARGAVFFSASDEHGVAQLWRSDGSAAGTLRVKNVGAVNVTNVAGTLFFSFGGYGLWKSDGTEAGTLLVKDVYVAELAAAGSTALFLSEDELWRSDGTTAGTVPVKTFRGQTTRFPYSLTSIGSSAFLAADGGNNGLELWKSDGTETGTVLVKNINAGPNRSVPSDPMALTAPGEQAFFTAKEPVHGRELWRSDGSEAGTELVKDINPGPADGVLAYAAPRLTVVDGTLFFFANDGVSGPALWKSDGTSAGTVRVGDTDPQPAAGVLALTPPDGFSGATNLTMVGDTLFFVYGGALWRSDGTAAGTSRVTDTFPNVHGAGPTELIDFHGRLLFSAFTGLWESDGTAAGTALLKEISPYFSRAPAELTVAGGTLLFSAGFLLPDGSASGRALWRSDGTTAGTSVVPARTGVRQLDPANFVAVNDTVFFSGTDGHTGYELWKSDGSSAGTVRVQDIAPGEPSSLPFYAFGQRRTFVATPSHLFFPADDGVNGAELWAVALSAYFPGCPGDCAHKGAVTVDDLVRGLHIVLGEMPLDTCPLLDVDGNGVASVNELVDAVKHALDGCA